ncbi:hypothetical protein A2960_00700 [Candidatus Gottesmanbacteria bacterium RIFCSPLOWO2_01_FULL_39_12b]|uniref:ArnT-like N-terminal domain-containing protein n=1 Tax=Candidatus Gottesmanbacteria bacterium RIFCSPLOWO2_01_FULL_39_12b TaxID=1798388 RepID=A0A1F6AQX5_9BACT|nr:MAG: hypothetical protein A2960_00700 [Candidatus Gottesmanbacteria bacterium RIFCSPLOWO2_01_FULL_39_12b]
MKIKLLILIILILAFTFFIRIYKLTSNPEGFDQTEAAFGYNAYSLLKTSRDEYGKFLPLVLTSIGDYKLSIFSYWEIPFITLFGLNEFSVRFSVVVASMISLILIYFIIDEILKKHKIALLSLFFVGISPWHIIMSRMAYDPMVAFMWFLFSIFLFIKWYRENRYYLLILSVIALAFAISTYYSVWLLFPFTIALYWLLIYRKRLNIKQLVYLTVILLIPVLIFVKLFLTTRGQRLYQDSTFQVDAFPLLAEQIREDQHEFPIYITRLFHNKLAFYPLFIIQNLFKNLSIDFLFLTGDKIDRRFYVPYNGVLYLWTMPFFLLGLFYFWKNQPARKNLFILGPIVIIFLGSAFSAFGSETERTLFSVPIFCFLISHGLLIIYDKVRKTHLNSIILGLSGILLIYNITYFNHQYFWHGNVHQPWGRNFGVSEMINTVSALKGKYGKVVVPDNTYIYFYFYNKTDPKIAWAESENINQKANFLQHRLRSKIGDYLAMPVECPAAGRLHVLYVCQGTKIPPNSRIIKIIRYRDEQPAFTMLEFSNSITQTTPPKNLNFMGKYGLIDDSENSYWKEELEIY